MLYKEKYKNHFLENDQLLENINALKKPLILYKEYIDTPYGTMVALGDDHALYFLQFEDHSFLPRILKNFTVKTHAQVIDTTTSRSVLMIKQELNEYFAGTLKEFKTPLHFTGTLFQQAVWHLLKTIPYGSTVSYGMVAKKLEHPSAFRAVARANATNLIALVVPCHRVINADDTIGGYAGGVDRKKLLLEHEKALKNNKIQRFDHDNR